METGRRAGGAIIALAMAWGGCSASTHPSDEPLASSSDRSASVEPLPSERLLPPCDEAGREPPPFPRSSEGADYRAIVLVTIGEGGEASHLCFRRVEGPLALEQKALAGRDEWRFPPEQSGQKRERTVTYRLRPPASE